MARSRSLASVREAARSCRNCRLWENATQTVFGEGAVQAGLVLVGEQPGDREDLAGHPFVGPAGRVLDDALAEAEVERSGVYVTNVVKHFKWRPSGKRRIHDKPSWTEINACLPWLEQELDLVSPRVVVLLGATAAQALLGRGFRVTKRHGETVSLGGSRSAVATIHPSAVLRARSDSARQEQFELLVGDLRAAARLLGSTAAKSPSASSAST